MRTCVVENLIKELKANENGVKISFIKKDNSERIAFGTLNEKLLPEKKEINISNNKQLKNIRFFDLDKKDWRSISQDVSTVTIF